MPKPPSRGRRSPPSGSGSSSRSRSRSYSGSDSRSRSSSLSRSLSRSRSRSSSSPSRSVSSRSRSPPPPRKRKVSPHNSPTSKANKSSSEESTDSDEDIDLKMVMEAKAQLADMRKSSTQLASTSMSRPVWSVKSTSPATNVDKEKSKAFQDAMERLLTLLPVKVKAALSNEKNFIDCLDVISYEADEEAIPLIQKFKADFASVDSTCLSFLNDHIEVSSRVDNYNQTVKAMKDTNLRVDEISAQQGERQSTIYLKQEKIKQLEAKITTLKQKVAAIKDEETKMMDELETLDSALDSYISQYNEDKTHVRSWRKKLKELAPKVEAAELKWTTLQGLLYDIFNKADKSSGKKQKKK